MKNKMMELIRESATNERAYEALDKIYALYDQLQYSSNLKQMAEDIYLWLNRYFNIDNANFSLFDIEKNHKEIVFTKGDEFYLDGDLSFFFIINTHTNLNAIVSFCASSKSQYEIISTQYNAIESALFQISPILQNGIIKKNFVESSSLDSVTKVYNRKYLIENLHKQIKLSKKSYDRIFFLMIGIDHFKAVVDEFDHDVGDKVLIELAKVIHSNISEFDMVARLSGDEFLVSILSLNSENEILNMAQKIIDDFSKIKIVVDENNQTLQKTICIGIDSYNAHDDNSINEIIKNADISLYEAKNRGRSSLFNYKELREEDTIELF